MRIAQICPYSISIPGGVQGQALGLARVMRQWGHDARVLAPTDGPPADSFVVPLGGSVLSPANGSIAPLSPDALTQMRTIRTLWEEDFDVVHIHEPFCPGPSITSLLVKSAPVIGTFHAAGDQPAYEQFGWLAQRIGRRLDRRIAVSAQAKALAAPAVGGSWEILFNGVDTERFRSTAPWPRSPGEERVVLFVGRHEERKGLAVLLTALESLPPDVTVWVVGHGPETDRLMARHRDDERIQWLGRVSDAERDARLAAADVFVTPALGGESFGIILLEAMAAGCPVVCSDIDGYVGVAGTLDGSPAAALLTPAGDANALADAVLAVLDNPETAAELRIQGAARADRFSLTALAQRYIEIYEELCALR